ncbi:MAG: methyl-accepting chemotaxis protein [Planctomycetaceae bacterium]
MKTYTLFIVSHAATASVITTLFVMAIHSGNPVHLGGAVAIALVAVGLVCWYLETRIQQGISLLESAATDHEASQTLRSGLEEFDRSATKIAKASLRWESIASHTRQQTRELQAMLTLLNRRGVNGDPTSAQLGELLAGLGQTLHSHLAQLERGTSEIEQFAKAITEGSESQGNAVVKTTSYIEQLASTIDAVSVSATSTQAAIEQNRVSAETALGLVRELIQGMNRVRAESQTSEKKLRGLCDPSQQISAMVGTISDIAARTDLLALNASIESIRAGEHGRGFAIVAEEVRKLAEQASSATREISSLIDAIQGVTQESIRGFERERMHVEAEVDRATAAEQTLQQICGMSERDITHVKQIASASAQQLQIAQDIILAVEQVTQTAKTSRSGAENIAWTMKSLSKMTAPFNAAIDRLRRCGDATAADYKENQSFDSQPSAVSSPIAIPVTLPLSTSSVASMG